MKYVIYSVNIGGYDEFNEPKIIDDNVRYILFTDNKYIRSDVWEINHVDFLGDLDSRKKARYIKLNPHKILPEHEISLWIDHNFTPEINNFEKFLHQINFKSEDNIMLFKHRFRDCIFDESNKVIEMKKETESVVQKVTKKYIDEGFPKNFGLYETGFMVRKNNQITNNFNDLWWNEILNGSGRDQLSQMYISWKYNFKISQILVGDSAYNNKFLKSKKHLKELKF